VHIILYIRASGTNCSHRSLIVQTPGFLWCVTKNCVDIQQDSLMQTIVLPVNNRTMRGRTWTGRRIAAGMRVRTESPASDGEVFSAGEVMLGGQWVHTRSWAVAGGWKGTRTGFHTTLYVPARGTKGCECDIKVLLGLRSTECY
jgi:hypothetical protein